VASHVGGEDGEHTTHRTVGFHSLANGLLSLVNLTQLVLQLAVVAVEFSDAKFRVRSHVLRCTFGCNVLDMLGPLSQRIKQLASTKGSHE
jgi:hypothetical protein